MSAKKAFAAMLLGCGVVACSVSPEETDSGEGALASDKFVDAENARAGEFIVVLKGSSSAVRSALAAKYNARVFHTYENVFSGFAAEMTDADARALSQESDVNFVQRNGVSYTSETQTNATWGIDRVDQVSLPLDKSYNYTLTGAGVTSVVIDTGVDANHADFEGRVATGFNAGTGSPTDSADVHGHGSHVAGTIGSKTWGLAKATKIVPVRVCNAQGQCPNADIVKGVDWVTANVAKPAVVNMSLGGAASGGPSAIEMAVSKSIQSGIVYVVAAGNSNKDACTFSPARIPEAITVGSTTETDGRSSFSNFGKCLDIYAPGSNIVSARKGGGSTTMSGTSMASPHTAGVVALLLQKFPEASPAQIADLLQKNATTGKVTGSGAGSPNLLLHIDSENITQ